VLGCLLIVGAIASLGRFEDRAPRSEPHLTPTPL
jgi:hypothetical protein